MNARVAALGVLVAAVVLTTGAAASPAYMTGAGQPSNRLASNEHSGHLWLPSKGKRGSFTVELRITSSGTPPIKRTRSWWLRSADTPAQHAMKGQYAQITGGGGRVLSGGHQAGWYARLFGTVSRSGGANQRVLITIKGRPNGTFVLTPLEPGVLERDSGTQRSFATG
jgi:hypothetical protein